MWYVPAPGSNDPPLRMRSIGNGAVITLDLRHDAAEAHLAAAMGQSRESQRERLAEALAGDPDVEAYRAANDRLRRAKKRQIEAEAGLRLLEQQRTDLSHADVDEIDRRLSELLPRITAAKELAGTWTAIAAEAMTEAERLHGPAKRKAESIAVTIAKELLAEARTARENAQAELCKAAGDAIDELLIAYAGAIALQGDPNDPSDSPIKRSQAIAISMLSESPTKGAPAGVVDGELATTDA